MDAERVTRSTNKRLLRCPQCALSPRFRSECVSAKRRKTKVSAGHTLASTVATRRPTAARQGHSVQKTIACSRFAVRVQRHVVSAKMDGSPPATPRAERVTESSAVPADESAMDVAADVSISDDEATGKGAAGGETMQGVVEAEEQREKRQETHAEGKRGEGEEEEEEPMCRYCLGGADEEDGTLISPCMCKGGQKYVHLSCLRRWQRMVLVSQPTHPSFYERDERQYTCNVCKSEFTCAPPTRQELMQSFTGAVVLPSHIILHRSGATLAVL